VTADDLEEEDVSAWDPNVLPPAGTARARGKDQLVLLATDSMRARRRPGAILALWGWQTTLAAFVALPSAAAVASWYGRHPSSDAPLWQPGGLPLLDLFLDARGARRETLVIALLVFFVAGFADLIPLGALLASMGYVTRDRRAPPPRALLSRALSALPTLATLFAMAAMAEGATIGVAFAVASYVSEAARSKLGEARADQTAWLAALAIVLFAGVVGVTHDLARAGTLRFRVRALRSWRLGFNALARAPVAIVWSWAWRALAGWVPVVVGAVVAARYGGRGGAALVALFCVHQLVLIARVAFRASWLASALRAVDRAHRVIPARRAVPTRRPSAL
jgi:hypothetical protein